MFEQMEINAENARITIDIGQELGNEILDDRLFDRATRIAGRHMKYDRIMLMITNEDKTILSYCGGYGFTDREKKHVVDYAIDLNESVNSVFYRAFTQNTPILINDMALLEKHSFQQSLELAEKINPFAFVVCPINVDGASHRPYHCREYNHQAAHEYPRQTSGHGGCPADQRCLQTPEI